MSGLPATQVGAFVRQQAEELTRIWRLARAEERRDVSPGLIDGMVESFLAAAGTELEAGGPPEAALRRAAGTLRLPSQALPGEIAAEWAIVADVLHTACDSLNADPAADGWLADAVAAADAATADGSGGALPAGVVLVRVWSSVAPPARDR